MNLMQNIKQECVFLENIINQTLKLTCKGSTESAVSITKTTGITVSTLHGEVENIEFNNNEILEVILFFNHRKGRAISNNLSEQSVINTVDSAINIARCTFVDVYAGIADKKFLAFYPIELDLCHPEKLNIKSIISLVSQAEQSALKYDKRIICTEGGKFNSHTITKVFGNSHGMLKSYSSTQYCLSCNVVAESNGTMEQNYAYTLSRLFNNLNSPEWVGQECARRTLKQLGSKKIKTIVAPVLFVSEIAVSLFEHLAVAIHGNNVCRKSTFLLDNLEKNIFPNWISIKECPHILNGLGSAPFDNEGVQTLNRILIQDRVLKSWLLDSYSARKMGLKSTGNAGGIYNWCVSYQNICLTELIKNMYTGLIVTNLMGQGVNIITGDYSRGASGFWVDHDEIKYPVNEITISGNLKEMFYNIASIGNDIEMRSNIRCGSVLISSMQIAGF